MPVALEQRVYTCLQRIQVGVIIQLIDRHQLGRIGFEPELAALITAQFGRRRVVILQQRLHGRLAQHTAAFGTGGLEAVERLLHVQVLVPRVKVIHFGEPLHACAVRVYALDHGGATVLLLDFVGASADLHRGGETFQIPFPRADSGFVEIIDIEHQTGGRGAENAEIADMRVAHALHRNASDWRGSQVIGHDEHGAPVEGERAGAHALVTQRNQIRYANRGLLLQKADRLTPALLDLPDGMCVQRRLGTSGDAGARTVARVGGLRPAGHVDGRIGGWGEMIFAHSHYHSAVPAWARTMPDMRTGAC